jgi:hypothetical protein
MHTILQVLSLSLFEATPLSELLGTFEKKMNTSKVAQLSSKIQNRGHKIGKIGVRYQLGQLLKNRKNGRQIPINSNTVMARWRDGQPYAPRKAPQGVDP